MIVMDSSSCMVDVAKFFMEFCMTESCGKCIPCRAGTAQMYDLLAKITQGTALLARALKAGRPGPYQLHTAIAACHAEPVTNWREVAALYGELARYEPTAVTEANRAVAVAMAEDPAAGLAILDSLGSRLIRWPQFHIARAELLRRTGQTGEAIAAFRRALDLPLPHPEQAFLERRISELRNTRDR